LLALTVYNWRANFTDPLKNQIDSA